MKILVKMKFGSHLYGTQTENSDTDYKGIFFPTGDQILTCSVPKSITVSNGSGDNTKNTAQDVDDELYSLPYFLELALKGETVALDMLHAPSEALIEYSPTWWNCLQLNRHRFYTKNLRSFVGYARKQAAKYGVKGSRLDAARQAINILLQHPHDTIEDIYNLLPENEHSHKYLITSIQHAELCWEVCGKKMMGKTLCSHYFPMMKKFYENYGARAQMAAKNEGIDWKAVSHALRAAYQARAIFKDGGFEYPLPEFETVKQVKLGLLSYSDYVAPLLEKLMDELEFLAVQSTLPEKPDREWAASFLREINYQTIILG